MSDKQAQAKDKRSFSIHPEIIFRIIDSQSGTLGKAFSEYVMNSIDASAGRVDIELTSEGFKVTDDGPGFHGLEQIEEFFETLGFPHNENDHRTYGSFGIGRAQMWSFASTVWRTGEFSMDVDIKKNGLSYDLKTGLDSKIGCEITGRFYSPLSPMELNEAINDLQNLIRYVQTPVIINGVLLNKNPSKEKWTHETADAFIKKTTAGGLKVYNLGVLVREYSAHSFGTSGVVVSKNQLKLNMARNDIILTKCETWKRIKKLLEDESLKTNKTKSRLTDDERINLIRRVLARDISFYREASELKLITDIKGRQWPISQLYKLNHRMPITVSPTIDSIVGGKAHDQKIMFVLSPKTLDEFGVETLQDLIKTINSISGVGFEYIKPQNIGDFSILKDMISSKYEYIPYSKLSQEEKIAMVHIGRLSCQINDITNNEYQDSGSKRYRPPRHLRVGVSETAEGWTDGQAFIALNRKLVNEARQGVAGFIRIGMVLLHEYCHSSADMGDHAHDFEFYNEFHDHSIDSKFNKRIVSAAQGFAAAIARKNIKIIKPAMLDREAEFRMNQAYEEAKMEDVIDKSDVFDDAVNTDNQTQRFSEENRDEDEEDVESSISMA